MSVASDHAKCGRAENAGKKCRDPLRVEATNRLIEKELFLKRFGGSLYSDCEEEPYA